MEKELIRYFSSVISTNLGIEVDPNRLQLDPYILVFLLPTWTSKVTWNTKRRFIEGEDVFTIIIGTTGEMLDFPELNKLDESEKNQVLNIYRSELYALHNLIEYYRNNMIDSTSSFKDIFTNMLMDTCSTYSTTMEEYVKINDHGIVYYVPYDILVEDLINGINTNPYTNEPYSNIIYNTMLKKYGIEIKMLCK